MKFTSKDLMKAMGLQVGDRVKLEDGIVKITEQDREIYYQTETGYFHIIELLIDEDYEILPRPKRVGDLKCGECSCATCPLRVLSCCSNCEVQKDTLYKILNYWNNGYLDFDQEIYDLLKARLDKEVVEE